MAPRNQPRLVSATCAVENISSQYETYSEDLQEQISATPSKIPSSSKATPGKKATRGKKTKSPMKSPMKNLERLFSLRNNGLERPSRAMQIERKE